MCRVDRFEGRQQRSCATGRGVLPPPRACTRSTPPSTAEASLPQLLDSAAALSRATTAARQESVFNGCELVIAGKKL